MWISEFKTKTLKSFCSFFNSHFAIRNPQSIPYFSLGQLCILFALALLTLSLLYFRFYHSPLPPSPSEIYREVVIDLAGEVNNPGIQFFRNPPTLRQAVEAAGGLKETAFQDGDSLSETLETGTLVTVAKKSPLEGSNDQIRIRLERMEAKKLLVFSIPLNLNRVSIEDLCLIPGIGEPLAQEIVTYRDQRKGFRSTEELKDVKGMGEKSGMPSSPTSWQNKVGNADCGMLN